MTVLGPDDNGIYKLVLGTMVNLDADLSAVIDLIQKSLDAARALDSKWTLLSAVKTMAFDVDGRPGLAFYVVAAKAWKPADNVGGEKLS